MQRIGVVLGAGGSVGVAFHAGVLAAVEQATGWDPRTADVVVGTSAGSISAALLRCGLGAADLRAMSENRPLSSAGAALADMGRPHRPRTRVAAFARPRPPAEPLAAVRSLLRPWRWDPRTFWSALLPEGPLSTDAISAGLDRVAGGRWPDEPLWLGSVRLRDGRRVLFGRPGAPPAPLGQAVAASCAIPAYFRPVSIGDDRYVDGGVASVHNADALVGEDLDVVIVSAPMSWTGRPPLRADLLLRQAVRLELEWEVARLRRRGAAVVVVAPDRRVVTAMGLDPMDARRRGVVSRQAAAMTAAMAQGGAFSIVGRARTASAA